MANYNLKDRDKYEITDRGFAIFGKFEDRYGSTITVQESSIAFEPCIWIFASNPRFKDSEPSPHLTPEQAQKLIDILKKFVDASKDEEKDEEND